MPKEQGKETMTKEDIIPMISERTGINEVATAIIINDLFNLIIECLKDNKKVRIKDFGVFKFIKYKKTTGQDVYRGKPVQIPAREVVRFKAGKEMRRLTRILSSQQEAVQ